MNNIIARYYRGITQQMRSEVDFINSLFHHQGVKGEGNEAVLRDLLTKFIPKRYGVGTGIVIDRHGNQSRQCDIVIYDTLLYPSLLSLTSVHLFPIDIVYATIEVKTTLDSQSAAQARRNIASVRELDFVPDKFMGAEPREEKFSIIAYSPDPPQGYVFAYNSDAQQFETFKRWFTPANEREIISSPIAVGCLDQGILLYKTPNEDQIEIRPEPHMQLIGWLLALKDEKGYPIELPELQENYIYDNAVYPIKKLDSKNIVIDQNRVLLLFLLLLQEMLSRKRINPGISFINHYLTDYLLNPRYDIYHS